MVSGTHRLLLREGRNNQSNPDFQTFFEGFRWMDRYTGWPQKNGTVDFSGLCSDQQLSFFTLLDRPSFPHYNNIKIIKFGWKLFIFWVISYGLSFLGFAHFQSSEARLMTASAVHNLNEYWVQWSVYCLKRITIEFSDKDLQSRHVIGTEISL